MAEVADLAVHGAHRRGGDGCVHAGVRHGPGGARSELPRGLMEWIETLPILSHEYDEINMAVVGADCG